MRRCLTGDLVAAASVVAAAGPPQRNRLAQSLIDEADAAHRYAKRFGRAHPVWGNGSLMSRALLVPGATPPSQQSTAYLASLALIARLVADRRLRFRTISC